MPETYGIKISLAGYPVETATPEQCSLHSDYACPKITLNQTPAHFGVYIKTWASAPAGDVETVLTTINHDLGYKPMSVVMIKFDELGTSKTEPLPAQLGASLQIYSYCTVDDLIIAVYRAEGGTDPTGETWTFKYYIFVENGA